MPSASALVRAMAYSTLVAPIVTTQNAFHAYALAFNEGLTEDAFEAALGTLSLPQTIETYSEDLCVASGPALYALWRFRPKALKAIATGIQECVTEVGDLRDWLSSSHTGTSNNHSSCQGFDVRPREQFVLFTRNVTENFSNMNLPRFIETMTSKGRFWCRSCEDDLQVDFLRVFSHLGQRINDRISKVHRELLPLFEGSETEKPVTPQTSGRNFGAPFNRSDADLIIRSSDQVDFHVHQSILGMASVVFEDMFTAPGPSPREQGQNKPVINLTEDSKTLHHLLTMFYPIERSMPETLEDTLSLCATCHKYQMDSTITSIRSLLKGHKPLLFTAQNSFHAYGIARRYHLKDEALVAARLTLERRLNFDECGKDLQFISGADLVKLWRYRAECTKVAKDCIGQLKSSDDTVQDRSTYYDIPPYSTGWCYDHFLSRVPGNPSPELITDRQEFGTAMRKQSHSARFMSQADVKRISESVRAEVEAKLKAAIDKVSIVFGS
ncbi:hypothetical protein BC827DRAFT_1338455 [Russula dissimulans]|nr:hypothetical protein BC827DRAFT_1338455 [Russula dissimulans]